MFQLLRCEKILSETRAEVNSDITECAFATGEFTEVHEYNLPLFIAFLADFLKVSEEVLPLLGMVDEAELTVYHLLLAAATYQLRLFKHRLVEIALHLIRWIAVEIDSHVFMALRTIGFRVPYRRVVVEIERDFSRWQEALAQGHFSTYIHSRFLIAKFVSDGMVIKLSTGKPSNNR